MEQKPGYYSGTWVDEQGHVGGPIRKLFFGPITEASKIPSMWIVAPFSVFYFDGDKFTTVAENSSDLLELKLGH
jgi:hypothetical protein